MQEELFEGESVGEQPRRAVVMVGRFQPPTRGHYKVISAMKAFIRDNKQLHLDATPVVVVIAGKKTGTDTSRNPLTAEERIGFMQASGKANGVKFLESSSAFAAFEDVRKSGFEPIAIAAGSDRAPEYLKMLDKYFTDASGKHIQHVVVPNLGRDADDEHDDGDHAFRKIVDMIDDGDVVDDSMISGSLARYAANNDNAVAFSYIVGLENKTRLASKLMDKIISVGKE